MTRCRVTMTSQRFADWYLWNEGIRMLFPCEEISDVWELGNPVEIPHSIIPHNRTAPVAWSGINFHKK